MSTPVNVEKAKLKSPFKGQIQQATLRAADHLELTIQDDQLLQAVRPGQGILGVTPLENVVQVDPAHAVRGDKRGRRVLRVAAINPLLFTHPGDSTLHRVIMADDDTEIVVSDFWVKVFHSSGRETWIGRCAVADMTPAPEGSR